MDLQCLEIPICVFAANCLLQAHILLVLEADWGIKYRQLPLVYMGLFGDYIGILVGVHLPSLP